MSLQRPVGNRLKELKYFFGRRYPGIAAAAAGPSRGAILDRLPRIFEDRRKVFRGGTAHPPSIEHSNQAMEESMKIVVIGGTGLIGSNVVARLRKQGHDVLPASPNTGVNTITGEGLAQALAGAEVVVDLANSPNFEDQAVMTFFQTSGRNLLAAEKTAGVGHHVALSVVGSDRLPKSGYLRAKVAQEDLIKASGIPYTILRSTQFFEFAPGIAQSAAEGASIRLPSALMQPVASDDVSALVAKLALATPINGTVELGGPEKIGMDAFVRRYLAAKGDPRQVIGDPHGIYFGTELDDASLNPGGGNPHLGTIKYDEWLSRMQKAA
jgi:uncharacterized protein YbjT (DUF2867 family)